MEKYDLLFNDSGQLLGEIDTVTGTSTQVVTLKGYTGNSVPVDEANSIWLIKLSDSNYLTGTNPP